MAHPKIESDVLLEKLFELFRETGYDGASLGQLAAATGLKKASLYHRFPAGKEQMAASVIDYASMWITTSILAPLVRTGDREARLAEALAGLRAFYDDGRKACLIRSLSVGPGTDAFRPAISDLLHEMIASFAHLARDFGLSEAEALQWAESVMVGVEGSLVVAGALQTPDYFQRTLARLVARLRQE